MSTTTERAAGASAIRPLPIHALAAWEQPELFASEPRAGFRSLR